MHSFKAVVPKYPQEQRHYTSLYSRTTPQQQLPAVSTLVQSITSPVRSATTPSSASSLSASKPVTTSSESSLECHHPECMSVSTSGSPQRCRKKIRSTPPSTPAQTATALRQASYSRPKEPKLYCKQCNAVPEGFRSEHELRRHSNRVHKTIRKVWITVDASPNKDFLSNCKACTTGKRYNECYNAASHLRRMHFHPRKRGEGKEDRRNGKRGSGSVRSEDPSMEDLKNGWLMEVEEFIVDSSSASDHKYDRESSTEDEFGSPKSAKASVTTVDTEMTDTSR